MEMSHAVEGLSFPHLALHGYTKPVQSISIEPV